jgi:hypothetical protein
MFLYLAVFNSLSPHTLLVSYYLLRECFSESISLSQASNNPIVSFPTRHHLPLRSLFECQLSHTGWACLKHITEGDGRYQNRQQTEDKTCVKVQPGRLDAVMETHQHPPPPVSLLYTVATQGREAFLRGGGMTMSSWGTGGTCDSISPNVNIKGKNSCTVLAHFRSWGCAIQACNLLGILYLLPSVVWDCAKLKHTAYSIHGSAPNT